MSEPFGHGLTKTTRSHFERQK